MAKARSNDPLTWGQTRELLDYNPKTGDLTWHERPRDMFPSDRAWKCWNTRYAGAVAGTQKKAYGYIQLAINGTLYLAHRVIWLWMTGDMPEEIDHQDGDTANNRWTNLRYATSSQNKMNRGARSDNTSGFKGVSFDRRRGTWNMSAESNGKRIRKTGFASAEAAHEAYCAAAAKLHGAFARTG